MNSSSSAFPYLPVPALATEQSRRRLVKAIIAFTEGTALYPESYERQLLDQFVRGQLTIDEVAACLEDKETIWPGAAQSS